MFRWSMVGYVRSPSWTGNIRTRGAIIATGRVDVPTNHSMMVSFLQGYSLTNTCSRSQLTIFIENRETQNAGSQYLVLCSGAPIPKPKVFQADHITFYYTSNSCQFQFKVLFSFHHASAVPEKASGKWNCSVTHWPHFQQHIGICNTVDECFGEEDEVNCSHVYRRCGRGSVLVGGRCYALVVQDMAITWKEAANKCLQRNAYLTSLNTPDEWDAVTEYFQQFTNSTIYIGLRGNGVNFPQLYRTSFQWVDETFAFYFNLIDKFLYHAKRYETCSYLTHEKRKGVIFLGLGLCNMKTTNAFLCEKDTTQNPYPTLDAIDNVRLHKVDWPKHGYHVTCPAGHAALKFVAYDVKSGCFASETDLTTGFYDMSVAPLPPYFKCSNGAERVHYTFVCDHRSDCSDKSDEDFCFFPLCKIGTFRCDNQQCLLIIKHCDGIVHCVDSSDEKKCHFYHILHKHNYITSPRPPAVISFTGRGFYEEKSMELSEVQTNTSRNYVCSETHFLCPGKWVYCMPVFVRCNGVVDCPGREDESGCNSYVCPGFYRCRASVICVHASHMCDGVFHCPQHDDEVLCGFVCPENCTCDGLAFFCPSPFQAENSRELRFFDGRGSKMSLGILKTNTMLVFLNLADCGLAYLDRVKFPNLRVLDLSRNQLRSFDVNDIQTMNKLQMLSLAGNPLASLFVAVNDQDVSFSTLKFLDVSDVLMATLNTTTFSIFPGLLFLNFSGCGVKRLVGGGFKSLKHLKSLDLRRCPMKVFPIDIFKNVWTLTEVWADNYKLCCSAVLPSVFQLTNCHSPSDEISSCDALLRANFYRIFLFVFSALAILGNLCSFVYRVFVNRAATNSGFGAFVTHLCVSDFLMGVYLAVIGVTDRLYMGSYLLNETSWKQSTVCCVAGFLSLLSSEVSAFIICLITLDRFLVLRFPFSRLHFRKQSAQMASGTAWLIGVVLAGIPLLPVTSHWEFYSQTGICIPLPITRNDFAGYKYSFSVTIVVNFVLFLLIAGGQAFVYWSIRTNSMAACDSTKKSNNLAIARRLITITMSDFMCWFPIGLLGLLAFKGVPIPGEVNVFVAILLLPVNSAMNPFLYTINTLLESRRQAQERRIHKMIMSTAVTNKNAVERLEDDRYTKRQAMQLIETWVLEDLVSVSSLEDFINKHA